MGQLPHYPMENFAHYGVYYWYSRAAAHCYGRVWSYSHDKCVLEGMPAEKGILHQTVLFGSCVRTGGLDHRPLCLGVFVGVFDREGYCPLQIVVRKAKINPLS
jgi:hypothetical protein